MNARRYAEDDDIMSAGRKEPVYPARSPPTLAITHAPSLRADTISSRLDFVLVIIHYSFLLDCFISWST